VSKRTLEELHLAQEYASNAQRFLAALSEDKAEGGLPYDREMALQRHMYGTVLLRKGADQVAQQEKYETEHKAKLDAARDVRMADRAAAAAKEVRIVISPLISSSILSILLASKTGRT
jgi:RNA polymerase-associated protein CTR9